MQGHGNGIGPAEEQLLSVAGDKLMTSNESRAPSTLLGFAASSLLAFLLLLHADVAQARHLPDQGQAYAECLLVGQLKIQMNPIWTNPQCEWHASCGGNPCYLCVADNVKGQSLHQQCTGVQGHSAIATYPVAATCLTRPTQPQGLTPSQSLSCSAGCELAAAGDGLLRATGSVCAATSTAVNPAKSNCCGEGSAQAITD